MYVGAPPGGLAALGDPSRVALVARTLQIDESLWRATLADFERTVPAAAPNESIDAELARCLPALGAAYRARSPHETELPPGTPSRACRACGRERQRPLLARKPGPLLYGRCDECGHGQLLGESLSESLELAAARARHAASDYYQARAANGVGYDDYGQELAYRESKGRRLVERLRAASGGAVKSLLEVGSGFGFTRIAAERLGLRTAGVDLNRAACTEAARRYGLPTFHGDLAEALSSASAPIAAGAWDAVLYQFVLEHVVDPLAELERARRALTPGGWLMLLVPSMDALEIEVFGASYRSFRADHLHLPSLCSMRLTLEQAGFEPVTLESSCNLHLLRGFVSEQALQHVYDSGHGPDLLVLARKKDVP